MSIIYPGWWFVEDTQTRYLGYLIDPCNRGWAMELCEWNFTIKDLCNIIDEYDLLHDNCNQDHKLRHEKFIKDAYIELLLRYNNYAQGLMEYLLTDLIYIWERFSKIPECFKICDIPTDNKHMKIYSDPKFRKKLGYYLDDDLQIRNVWKKVIEEIEYIISSCLEDYNAKKAETKNIMKLYYNLLDKVKDCKSGDMIEISADLIMGTNENI